MSTTFPTTLDALTNPESSDYLDDPSHSAQHINANDAIEAVQTKVGSGANDNTPAENKILRGTGAGTSEWDTDLKDEDNMASDSATAVATQQSIKAYVDSVLGNANTHAVDFEDSSSQYAYKTDTASLSITGDITIEAWIKLESVTGNHWIVSKYDSSGDGHGVSYGFKYASGTLTFVISDDATSVENYTNSITLDLNKWLHVAVTWEASISTANFYLNGVNIGSDTGSMTAIDDNTSVFCVGGLYQSGPAIQFFDGAIDEVRVWSEVRTAEEIERYRTIQLLGSESNLQGYWRFDNDYTDETSNSNDLTASGSPTFTEFCPFLQ